MFMVSRDSSYYFTSDLCSRHMKTLQLHYLVYKSNLSIILKPERPEVDKEKEDLIKAQRVFKLQLRQLEEELLIALNSEEILDILMKKLSD